MCPHTSCIDCCIGCMLLVPTSCNLHWCWSWPFATCTGGVSPSINWHKYSTCSHGDDHLLQLVQVAFFLPANLVAQILHLHSWNMYCGVHGAVCGSIIVVYLIPHSHGNGLVISGVYSRYVLVIIWWVHRYTSDSRIYPQKVNWPHDRHGQWGIN